MGRISFLCYLLLCYLVRNSSQNLLGCNIFLELYVDILSHVSCKMLQIPNFALACSFKLENGGSQKKWVYNAVFSVDNLLRAQIFGTIMIQN